MLKPIRVQTERVCLLEFDDLFLVNLMGILQLPDFGGKVLTNVTRVGVGRYAAGQQAGLYCDCPDIWYMWDMYDMWAVWDIWDTDIIEMNENWDVWKWYMLF